MPLDLLYDSSMTSYCVSEKKIKATYYRVSEKIYNIYNYMNIPVGYTQKAEILVIFSTTILLNRFYCMQHDIYWFVVPVPDATIATVSPV